MEHLRNQLQKQDPELLDRLGWTPEQAKDWLAKWEGWFRDAGREGGRDEAARTSLDEALRRLGLRPHGTDLRGGGTVSDQLQNMREAGRFAPPPNWAELLREYTRGLSGSGR